MSVTRSSASAYANPESRHRRLGCDSALGDAVEWRFERNCSLTPSQLLRCYLLICALSLGVAAFFWVQGARLVLPFAGLEMLALGASLLVYARHARDRESIFLNDQRVHVEHLSGNRLEQVDFDPAWVRVEPASNDRSLVEISGQGRRIAVGRFLRPELRSQLARELRQALSRWRLGGVVGTAVHPAQMI